MNLATNLVRTVEIPPYRVAVRLGQSELTYQGLDEASARVAGLLAARGLRPGDRVGLVLPNVPEFAAIYYGVLRAGGVVVPMNRRRKGRAICDQAVFGASCHLTHGLPTRQQQLCYIETVWSI